MRELRQLIQTVAPTDARVLVLGESGTGKELVAGALHGLSQRARASYVRINCAAIPETLLESELFGHEKGAFTGALKQKPGRVEEADGGTIFLDEIADMSRPLQAKLLRFLEDGTFTRVGGTQELRVNVRLIAATNRDIVEAIAEGQFREDLFHRLNVVQFRLPPLRERGRGRAAAGRAFPETFGAVAEQEHADGIAPRRPPEAAVAPLAGQRARTAQRDRTRADPGDHPAKSSPPACRISRSKPGCTRPRRPGLAATSRSTTCWRDFERELITGVLEQNHFSLTRTAEQLKISRHALRYRMQRLNMDFSDNAPEESP